jgi:hypothetical protein
MDSTKKPHADAAKSVTPCALIASTIQMVTVPNVKPVSILKDIPVLPPVQMVNTLMPTLEPVTLVMLLVLLAQVLMLTNVSPVSLQTSYIITDVETLVQTDIPEEKKEEFVYLVMLLV